MAGSNSQPEINQQSPRELRKFGWSLGLAWGIIFGGILPFILSFSYPTWPWLVTLVLVGMSEISPTYLSVVYRGWFKFAELLHYMTNPLILGIIFFGLVLPLGLIKRSLGKSKIQLKIDSDRDTYRSPPTLSDDFRDPF